MIKFVNKSVKIVSGQTTDFEHRRAFTWPLTVKLITRVRFAVEMIHVRVRVGRWVKVERRKERKRVGVCYLLLRWSREVVWWGAAKSYCVLRTLKPSSEFGVQASESLRFAFVSSHWSPPRPQDKKNKGLWEAHDIPRLPLFLFAHSVSTHSCSLSAYLLIETRALESFSLQRFTALSQSEPVRIHQTAL